MTHFKDWLWIHFDQIIGFVGGFSYGLLNIHLALPVQEFMFKILVALFVGFMTAFGGDGIVADRVGRFFKHSGEFDVAEDAYRRAR